MAKEMSRRSFLKTGAAAALGLAVVPSTVLGKKFGYTAPSDKLNILGVGVGGRGAADLQAMESQNIIGLCDVDWKYADHVFKRYPAAKKYNDYRRMYDELLKEADAVMVATADHTHAIIAAEAMTAGKHVYVEKPLTHSVYESRLLTKLAAKHKVATQMGNQGASAEGVRKVCEWIWNGEIGEVKAASANLCYPVSGKARMTDPACAGGALLDVGVYPLNFLDMAIGADHGRTLDHFDTSMVPAETGVDAQNSTTLYYSDGTMAVSTSSMLVSSDRGGYVWGTEGYLVVTNINNPESIDIYDNAHKPVRSIAVPPVMSMRWPMRPTRCWTARSNARRCRTPTPSASWS